MTIGELWRRLRFWRRRDALTEELAEELESHIELLARDFEGQGMSRAEALANARRRLGNVGRIRETSRDSWGFPLLDAAAQDLRYALRGLRKNPAFTAAVVLTLGLGIGANAVMFGVVDRLMFRPFPYLRSPGHVHRVYLRSTDRGREVVSSATEFTRYLDLQRWTTSFSQTAAFTDRSIAVGSGAAARERIVALVGQSFFDFFDAVPVLGRFFLNEEAAVPKGANVVVLGYGFWQTEFGGRDVIGQSLQVGPLHCTIVGVAPRGFVGVAEDGPPPAVFLPITTYASNHSNVRQRENYYRNYNWGWMGMMVRRKPGVSRDQASADLTGAYVRSWNAERALSPGLPPAETAQPSALASGMKSAAGPDPGLEARTAVWVAGVALIVLLITCANVANLLLARALRRRRETAVRVALGVSRARLLGQCLVESLVLAVLGAAAGLLIAQWGGVGIRRLFAATGTATPEVITDGRTLAVAGIAALAVGLIAGLAPAVLAGRARISESLKSGARGGGGVRNRTRVRSGLLLAQVALSVGLLIGAGLFVRSLDRVKSLRLGYDVEPVLVATPNFRGIPVTDQEQIAVGRRVLQRSRELPGVESAAWAGSFPFYSSSGTGLYIPGIDSVSKLGRFTYQNATADYFATMGTRVLRGRPFNAQDRSGTPLVAVVSESMARVLWPGRDALGQCMKVGADTMPCTTVVGIAEDAHQRSLIGDAHLHYYLPLEQFGEGEGFILIARVRGDPVHEVETLRRELQKEMPGEGYVVVRRFGAMVDSQRRSWRFGATMFSAFGVLAVLVAAVGLYGLIGYNVDQRMHELGVRVALGARRMDVVRMVTRQGVTLSILGTAVGAALALFASKWLQPLLFDQSATDPLVYGGVAALLVLVAVVACVSPARRASGADPNVALRAE